MSMNIGSTMGSAFTSGSYAISQGNNQVQRAAQDVVDATTSRPVEGVGDLSKPMTDLKQAEHLVKAGSKVIQAADAQTGTLLDIMA
ncbi:MAG: hypothetical protein RL217_1906 [Pseudomonadota bacterium]|jgi:hypothetical protein